MSNKHFANALFSLEAILKCSLLPQVHRSFQPSIALASIVTLLFQLLEWEPDLTTLKGLGIFGR